MCSRVWRPWRARCSSRCSSELASSADRYASSGTLESTTTSLPPGSRTSMSGRSAPSSVSIVLCSRKSQWDTMPAISTTLRSWISPHEPRVAGRFRAETRFPASWRSVPTPSPSWRSICASSPCASRRSRSRRPISLSILPSFSCTGRISPLISSARLAISPAARSCSARRPSSSRRASASPVCASTSADSDLSSSRVRWRSCARSAPRRSSRRRTRAAAHTAPRSSAPISKATVMDRAAWHPSRTTSRARGRCKPRLTA